MNNPSKISSRSYSSIFSNITSVYPLSNEDQSLAKELNELANALRNNPINPVLKHQFVTASQKACERSSWFLLNPYIELLRTAYNFEGITLFQWAKEKNDKQILKHLEQIFSVRVGLL